MGISQRLYVSQKLMLKQQVLVYMPQMQWSLVAAFKNGFAAPPSYTPPTFEEEVFTPHLKLEQQRLDFTGTTWIQRLKMIDEANYWFRFAYTRGRDDQEREKGYFKIPLLRNTSVNADDIKMKIGRREYLLATAILDAVGEMERIVRAIPYYGIYKTVAQHLKYHHHVGTSEEQVLLVSIDRGGRIPTLVLREALGHKTFETIKIDQGGGKLDEGKLNDLVARETFKGKHVLLVDSTVDSGRQIRVLERYFKDALGHRSWSVVGSNEDGQDLDHHCNVNWGVDPDATFEDDPQLMGIDYAPGNYTKVVECPSAASETIKRAILSVPAGIVYDFDNVVEQINWQFQEWHKRQGIRRAHHVEEVAVAEAEHERVTAEWQREQDEAILLEDAESEWHRITGSSRWQKASSRSASILFDNLPSSIPNGVSHYLRNILVVGTGGSVDLTVAAVNLIVDTLGPYHSFFAGTPAGNPGAVLKTVLERVPNPEVRLYQPDFQAGRVDANFGGVPVVFVGPSKEEMRRQMVETSDIALVLGGAEGTLREVILALKLGKPTVIINGWGPVPDCLLKEKKYRVLPHLKACNSIAEALQTIMDMTKT